MDDVTATDWAEAPWWLDAVAETDTVGCPEQWAELAELGPLSVEETLLAIAAAGPGPEAARLLVSLRGQPLTDEQKLTVVGLWQPQLAWTTAAEQAALLDLVGPEPDPHDKQASGAVRRVRPAGAGRRPAQHGAARGRADPAGPADGFHFTATQQLLAEGRIDGYRVWLMLQTLTTLPPELARQVEADILPRAAGLTGAELRTAVRDAARKVDPDWGVRMFAKTRKTRRVGFDHRGTDGLVLLYAYLPPVEAVAIQEHLHRAAAVPSPHPGDERSVDERMADALIGCVLGSTPGDVTTPLAPQVITRLLISLPTLLGLRQDTGELAGYGKIPAGMARQLATDSEFQRMIYHPVDG
ncbi:MAG: hypothetical protein QOJ11_1340, partial [Frankiales bacterium]|nr:hypothetical protein [Frankiales bacterium]